jgi:deoxyribodipyrimidine photolyase-related protein
MQHADISLANCATAPTHFKRQFETLALVLGDQLNASHSWFSEVDDQRLIVLMEVRQETDYVRHHQQKILAFFAAMRAFATALAKVGHQVLYLRLDSEHNKHCLTSNLAALSQTFQVQQICLQQADEYRVDQQLQQFAANSAIAVSWHDSEHFLTERDSLQRWFPQAKNYLMEYFYRRVRKQTGYLMGADKQPLGGQWNFDKANRNKLPKQLNIPTPLLFSNDLTELARLLKTQQVDHFGKVDAAQFLWPINRAQARQLLSFFVSELLPNFGRYQDAMTVRGWSLYHARLSFSLNSKILSPREVVEAAISAWQQHPERIDLAQIEGFVRQIIGWREFVRAMYWHHMPSYRSLNYFDHQRPLPAFYWHGNTNMRCMAHSIQQSLDYAYAHHIQRLMVTGNFALLAGVHPDAVDAWYLGIYIDALEWVELPNTRGMSQFADGGLLASKPYISSGAYINKMSDYCVSCYYDVQQKTGPRACPFNSLYWHFIDQHFERLKHNPRMALITKQWQQRSDAERDSLLQQARDYLARLDQL